ncbi:M13 family peptidase [Brumimicrobium glaciale]|uniref:M13 family peptidase n=1 Tax=Brumimicrobium glaciale TaxID=200475 RepID=A0A4Q4KKS8_9FLAO|nr:M13 family metallopeptidase [Brumimicrobium glaciale]RYM33598.1 M13 family peptidase [Brumimicrobium glaciale]
MKIINKTLLFVAGASLLASCGTSKKDTKEISQNGLYTINVDYLDKSTAPTADFFQYANGTWIKNNPVPASESRWGSFNELDQRNKEKLTIILDEACSVDAGKGSDLQIIGDYYEAMKDMDMRNEVSPKKIFMIKEELSRLTDISTLPKTVLMMKEKGIGAFSSLYVGQDLKNVNVNTLYLSQGGLGLPNRDYYFDDSKADIRDSYLKYMTIAFELFNFSDPENRANEVLKFEMKMAESMMKPAELRIPENTYNPIDINDVDQIANFIDIKNIVSKYSGDNRIEHVIVGQPENLKFISQIITEEKFETVKNYIAWKYINHYAPYMDDKMVRVNFDFYGTTLSGIKEMKPMNERAIEEMTNKTVKTALAKEFVARHFSEEAKTKVNTMVDNLLAVYEERINNLDWMTDETKTEALKKLNAIGRKLGYPDKWKSLDRLEIKNNDYLANIDACNHFSYKENMSKLGKPVDKDEWGMPAHMVNAYYHPLLNEIAFPAGIMQAPFFDVNAEDAVNYGGIGMVIGHEFTHGFDDMGSKFAADGSFTNWWSDEDRENFEERTERLGKTFSNFCPIEGHCVNSELTMGENIADLGGITMAYYAYAMTNEFKKDEKREGFTPAQRFFLAYAQLWKINYTDAELKKRLATDSHSPGKYRVNGPLMNSPEFFKAFNVQEGDAMRKNEKEISKIW